MKARTPPSLSDPVELSKGAAAREKMLQAALVVFGQYGFDGATTRMLAQEAQMNLGAIPYYFGSKEDLYAQGADYLAGFIEIRQAALLQQLQDNVGLASGKQALCDLVVGFLIAQAKIVLSQDIPTSWLHFFLRAQAERGPAFECLNRRVVEPSQTILTPLIGRIIRREADDPVTRTLAFLGLHQALYLRLADTMLMHRMDWDAITPERMAVLLDSVAQAMRVQLMHYPEGDQR